MSIWSKFRQLQASERLLLAQALLLLPLAALLVRLAGFQRAQGLLARWTRLRPAHQEERLLLRQGRRVAYVVDGAARYGPFRATCLPRSLVCWWLLRHQGIDTSLHIGVRKSPSDQLEAHAWVERHGQVLNDYGNVRERYQAFARAVVPTGSLRA